MINPIVVTTLLLSYFLHRYEQKYIMNRNYFRQVDSAFYQLYWLKLSFSLVDISKIEELYNKIKRVFFQNNVGNGTSEMRMNP